VKLDIQFSTPSTRKRFYSFRYALFYFWKHVKYVVTYSRTILAFRNESVMVETAYFRGVLEVPTGIFVT